jgi:hypothetical protein
MVVHTLLLGVQTHEALKEILRLIARALRIGIQCDLIIPAVAIDAKEMIADKDKLSC